MSPVARSLLRLNLGLLSTGTIATNATSRVSPIAAATAMFSSSSSLDGAAAVSRLSRRHEHICSASLRLKMDCFSSPSRQQQQQHIGLPQARRLSTATTADPSSSSSPGAGRPGTFNIDSNPYKAKRQWPPDMSQLSEKQQFRLERKYRRRTQLKYARPTWKKWTTLVQWVTIGAVIIYSIFFLELEIDHNGQNPFQGLRDWAAKYFGNAFSQTPKTTPPASTTTTTTTSPSSGNSEDASPEPSR